MSLTTEDTEDTEDTELKSCTKIHAKELLAGFSSDENWSKYAEALENLCRILERQRDDARDLLKAVLKNKFGTDVTFLPPEGDQ